MKDAHTNLIDHNESQLTESPVGYQRIDYGIRLVIKMQFN